jgi:hypothetical protein
VREINARFTVEVQEDWAFVTVQPEQKTAISDEEKMALSHLARMDGKNRL